MRDNKRPQSKAEIGNMISERKRGIAMNVPSHLYKYRSLRSKKDRERTLRIISHNEVYFARRKEFNDPFDCNLHISVDGDCDTHKAKLKQLEPQLSEEELNLRTRRDLQPENIRKRELKVNRDIRSINEEVGIFTLSAKPHNLLMWSHYADYHRGICIEFRTTRGKLFGCDILRVDYSDKYPKFNVYDDMDLERVREYICTKSLDWEYEEEWRIVYKETGCQLFQPEDKELTGVILGARISNRNKQLVAECLAESNCGAKLYQARECKDRFGLEILA